MCRSTVYTMRRSSTYTSFNCTAPVGAIAGAAGTKYATSCGWYGFDTSYARTPALNQVPRMMSSERHEVGTGRFSCRLCAPKRPPRCAKVECGGVGQVAIGTRFDSTRASTTHTIFGQSTPSSFTHSSLTMSRFFENNGSTVWQKPLKGGE